MQYSRRKRKNIMLCYPFEVKRLDKWGYPVLTQPKLDGVRCRALMQRKGDSIISERVADYVQISNTVNLLSSTERHILSLPHMFDILDEIAGSLPGPLELDGELYRHGWNFERIHSVVSKTTSYHSDSAMIQYHVFDVILSGMTQLERAVWLKEWWEKLPNQAKNVIHLVQSSVVHSFEELMNNYHIYLNQGYEGIIVRNLDAEYVRKRSTYIMKFKPKKFDVYIITGYKEEISKDGHPKGILGALICRGDDGTSFDVGSGLKYAQKIKYWRERNILKGKFVKVQYQHLTPGKGVPRFPVFIEIKDYNEEVLEDEFERADNSKDFETRYQGKFK